MEEVQIPLRDGGKIDAFLVVPANAAALVLFAHGSGSGRHSVRNRFVADILDGAGIGTLLLDLLTEAEERVDRETAEYRFDVELLASRLVDATEWVRSRAETASLRLGYYGASTGAAAALVAAAQLQDTIAAVVSRGGRPDLAGEALRSVTARTLLIVGGEDRAVIDLNRKAAEMLRAPHELVIVPGAGHLFEEPGTLAQVARLTRKWYDRYLNAV